MYPYKDFEFEFNNKKYTVPIVDIDAYAKEDNAINWKDKFVYVPIGNNHPRYDISIIKFLRIHSEIITNISEIKSARNAYDIISNISDVYVKWVFEEMKIPENTHSNLTKESLSNWVKGMLGEYFWCSLLNHVGTIYIKNNNSSDVYKFMNICHPDGNDFGVDAIGEVERNNERIRNCIFQFKFWNPNNKDNFFTEVKAMSVSADGYNNKFISQYEDKPCIFICWLGNDKQVSTWIKRNELLSEKIKFIDLHTIKVSDSKIMYKQILEDFKKIINF